MQTRRWTRGSLLRLVAIVLMAAAVRVYLFRGFVGLDDAEYARLAHQVSAGTFDRAAYPGPPVFPLRVGVVLPTAAMFHVFGVNEGAMVAYSLILSLCGIVLVFFCADWFFGPRAGLIAAVLLAVFPWDIESATKLLPDLPSAFYGALGIVILFVVERVPVERRGRLVAGGMLAGLAFGVSWLSKEAVAYLAPFCLVLIATGARRNPSRTILVWLGFACGAGTVLFGEMLYYQHATGDLLFRFHETERNYQLNQKYFFTEGSQFGWQAGTSHRQALMQRLFVSGPRTILLNYSFLYLPLIAVAASLYALLRKDRSFTLPVLWFWCVALMFNFSSSSTASYTPLALFDRYLYCLYYPTIVLVAGFLAKTVFDRREAGTTRLRLFQVTGFAAASVIVWAGASQLLLNLKYPSRWLSDVRAVKSLVTPGTPLYTDTLTLRALEFLRAYPSTTAWVDFNQVGAPDAIRPDSLVLVNQPYIAWLDQHGGIWDSRKAGYPTFPFYRNPPRSWKAVWTGRTLSLYRSTDSTLQ